MDIAIPLGSVLTSSKSLFISASETVSKNTDLDYTIHAPGLRLNLESDELDSRARTFEYCHYVEIYLVAARHSGHFDTAVVPHHQENSDADIELRRL